MTCSAACGQTPGRHSRTDRRLPYVKAGQLQERAVPPSRLSLLGLVRHMTEVERWWFRMHAANTDMPFPYDPDQTGQDFEALDD